MLIVFKTISILIGCLMLLAVKGNANGLQSYKAVIFCIAWILCGVALILIPIIKGE